MSLTLVSPPAAEPLTVSEVKAQLRLGSTSGEPEPTAPTLALASPAAPGNCDNGDWRVGFTFKTADGETPLGQLSAAVTVSDKSVNGQLAVSNVAIGGAAVTGRNAYAIPPGGTVALFAGLLGDNVSTSMVLNLAASALGAQAPTVNTTADPELVRMIKAARRRAERATRRALITQTWDAFLDQWPTWDGYHGGRTFEPVNTLLPAGGWVELPKPPLKSVTYVKYIDLAGVTNTWDPTNYLIDAPQGPYCRKGRLSLGWVKVWPIIRPVANAIQIRQICGYGDAAADVPELILQAMLMDIGTMYEIRGAVLAGLRAAAIEIPRTTADIYLSFRAM